LETPRVFVVSVDAAIGDSIKELAESTGLQAQTFSSLQAFLDAVVPGMDGNASIRCLHALSPTLNFIVHTGSADYTLPPDLQKLELDDEQIYLKPLLDMMPLARTVRRLMERDARDA
jgi:FixJ family two-component response regulator